MNAITPTRNHTVLDSIFAEVIEIGHYAAADPFAMSSPREFVASLHPVVTVDIDDMQETITAHLTTDDVAALVRELVRHGAAAERAAGRDAAVWVAAVVREMEGWG